MRDYLILIGFIIFLTFCDNNNSSIDKPGFEQEEFPLVVERRDETKEYRKPEFKIEEKLGKPFGTFIKLKAEIFDGDSLHTKFGQGIYLLKVISVDDKFLEKPVIIEFEDQSGKFPKDDLGLREYKEKIKNGEIPGKELNENIDKYVGSEYDIVGYETGGFTGSPYGGDYEFSIIPCSLEFHFRNYLVVLAELTDIN